MARDRANIRTDMLGDDDYRSLTRDEQWLYKLLLIHSSLSYAGVGDWRPGKLAAIAKGTKPDEINKIGAGLQAKHFVYVDHDTEEVFVRTFVKHDGLLKQYRLPVSMANDYTSIASREIREFFVYELQRIHKESPDLKCWEVGRVTDLLKRPSANMKEVTYADPYAVPYAEGYGIDPYEGYGMPTTTTTTTATTTSSYEEGCGEESGSEPATSAVAAQVSQAPPKPKKGSRVPEDWVPSKDLVQAMTKECPNVNQQAEHRVFMDYWKSQPGAKGVKLDWEATYRNWIRREAKSNPRNTTASDRRLQQGYEITQRAAQRTEQPDPFRKEITE